MKWGLTHFVASQGEALAVPAIRRTSCRRLGYTAFATGVILVVWLLLFPYSGDGDASLHLHNLRQGWENLAYILHAWARPLYALLMMPAAYFGNIPVRLFTAMLSLALFWQTVRLAEDMGLKRVLWAGPLTLFQPFAFALASDTMTEIPMALLMVVSVRCWVGRRFGWSALLIGLSPLVRPEGFFFGLMWGGMFLTSWPSPLAVGRRIGCLGLMTLGMLGWIALCWAVTGNPMYFRKAWSWTTDYGNGAWYHYLRALPLILGLPIFALWVVGIVPSIRKAMVLPWLVFLVVFVTHSVLWAGGWQASAGLLRIIACVAPFAALVAVHGLEVVEGWLDRKRSAGRIKSMAGAFLLFSIVFVAMGTYVVQPANHEFRLFQSVLPEMKLQMKQVGPDATLVLSDTAMRNMLEIPPTGRTVMKNSYDRDEQLARLASQPIGTIGVWDNQRGRAWHKVTIGDLESLGYEVVRRDHRRVYGWWGGVQDMEIAVVRKAE